MPIKKSDYPANWATEIVPAILHRAGERREKGKIVKEARCEWCNAPNHRWIVRGHLGHFREVEYAGKKKLVHCGDFHELDAKNEFAVRIVLTTAHLNRDRSNNELDNLASLCQRCHLNHDREAQHIPNRRYGRYHSRQPKLFEKDG